MSESRHPSLDERFDPAVRIVEYDPAWPEMAAAEIERIAAAVGEGTVRIGHVGSTAVPGLAARRGASTSGATSPSGTTCVHIPTRSLATRT